MTAVLSEVIELLVGGITGIASGIGAGLSTLVESIAFTTGEGGTRQMSAFLGIIALFGGISLAVSLSRGVVKLVGSLGGSRF